jgi:simple sugar transport system ATP-binding protein
MSEAVRAEGLVKRFGSVTALAGVSLQLRRGETLGILGDNGAGKSTLIKILTGFHQPDEGQVFIDGRPVALGSVDEARALGIDCVYQDLALVNGLSVYHNLFLNRELRRPGPFRLLDHGAMRRRAAQALAEIGIELASVEIEVGALSGGQRQAIAVARAVSSNARILLLDEPLAAMGARESRLIIDLVKDLAKSGRVSIIVIDHNYAHLFELCDRINVMQGGRITINQQVHETSLEELTELMVSSYRRQIEEVQNAGA